MNWVSDDLVAPGVSGTAVVASDVISKTFHCEDPRYLIVEVTGGLTAFKIQGRSGDGTWRDIATSAAARYAFRHEAETDLLDEQVRVIANGSGNVTQVNVTRCV